MTMVTVVDYDRGNLFSVCRGLQHCGAEVERTGSPERLLAAERLVLPGVGAFGDAAEELRRRDLFEPLREYAKNGRPFLGICVGMQLFFETSEEFGQHEGLGLIPGRVVEIPRAGRDGRPHKIPHIGWSEIIASSDSVTWDRTILDGAPTPTYCYFVHSFISVPTLQEHRLSDCEYGGRRISAVVRRDNLWGCQFHPEKSGGVGLHILKNCLALR